MPLIDVEGGRPRNQHIARPNEITTLTLPIKAVRLSCQATQVLDSEYWAPRVAPVFRLEGVPVDIGSEVLNSASSPTIRNPRNAMLPRVW